MSDKIKEKILDKVRKLLALSEDQGASEGEIENALRMAQQLMMKHNIDSGEINISPLDIGEDLIDSHFKHGEAKFWLWNLLTIIGKGHNCTVFKKGYKDNYFYRIVGFNEDRIIVKSLFEATYPLIRNLYNQRWKESSKNTSKGIFIRSYIDGFLLGLNRKLQADKKEFLKIDSEAKKYELIVVKKDDLIEDYIKETTKKTKEEKGRSRDINSDAFYQGVDDGSETSMNKKLH